MLFNRRAMCMIKIIFALKLSENMKMHLYSIVQYFLTDLLFNFMLPQ